ncbi:unnamed protein product [Vicia faba]|uniref:Uncharacterized protein n=1 Tax=Vicia faba TaxID=3906 RepID=A0AAV0ZXF2_VICFA|nr:unnamed protein product [Vicia faba]
MVESTEKTITQLRHQYSCGTYGSFDLKKDVEFEIDDSSNGDTGGKLKEVHEVHMLNATFCNLHYITITDLRRLLVRSFTECFSSSGDALMSFSTTSKALSTCNQGKNLQSIKLLANRSLPLIAISQSFTVFISIAFLLTKLKILNTNVGRLALSSLMFTDVVSLPMLYAPWCRFFQTVATEDLYK